VQVSAAPPTPIEQRELPKMQAHHLNPLTGEDEMNEVPSPMQAIRQRGPVPPLDPNNPRTWGKVSRNAPCPCGSGRKFKHCHGALV
jgi:preprotein translocase subunit SecA